MILESNEQSVGSSQGLFPHTYSAKESVMALKESTMLALGTSMPNFALPDVRTQKIISPETFQEKSALLVMFVCRHCP